jgi:cell division transport system ATP-binding protein
MLKFPQVQSPCEPSVRLLRVSHRYGKRRSVRDISLAVWPGELVYLIGPSASGKTTVLKLIHGEVRASEGIVCVNGKPVGPSLQSLRRSVGVVFQEYRLLERRTALENIAYALRVADLAIGREEIDRRAMEALRECGISGRSAAYPPELSGGQRQRLAIARALASRPRVLLADEPTASLDPENANRIVRLLEAIAAKGTSVILATHDRSLVRNSAQRIVELGEGRIVSKEEDEARRVWG